jgi:hypothetical protein
VKGPDSLSRWFSFFVTHDFSLNQLRVAAERAFGTPFAAAPESQHFVMQTRLITLMKAGHRTLSFLNYTKPYGVDGRGLRQGWS